MRLVPLAEGSITTDGTEQIIISSDEPAILSGWFSLHELQAGDTIIIRQYIAVNSTYILYAQETYNGVQTEPALYISPRRHRDKIKLTVQQTTGTYRTFDYEFVKEV